MFEMQPSPVKPDSGAPPHSYTPVCPVQGCRGHLVAIVSPQGHKVAPGTPAAHQARRRKAARGFPPLVGFLRTGRAGRGSSNVITKMYFLFLLQGRAGISILYVYHTSEQQLRFNNVYCLLRRLQKQSINPLRNKCNCKNAKNAAKKTSGPKLFLFLAA